MYELFGTITPNQTNKWAQYVQRLTENKCTFQCLAFSCSIMFAISGSTASRGEFNCFGDYIKKKKKKQTNKQTK